MRSRRPDRGGGIEGVPAPPSDRGSWALALALAALGAGTLAAVLSGAVGSTRIAPPALPVRAAVPTAAQSRLDPATGRRIYASDVTAAGRRPAIVSPDPEGGGSAAHARRGAGEGGSPPRAQGFEDVLSTAVPRTWLEGFYPIYETAQHAFGVNWLLIASIHAQETAFSTAPSTYHGLNFARCCGGPMQFNVTNGSAPPPRARPPRTRPPGAGRPGALSTWAQVAYSYRYAPRPASYDHRTARHPSIYDDFDSIMAAAHLLSLDGAGYALDYSAWSSAYDYYGHDLNGVAYADQVLARAIGWSQHGFCADCGVSAALTTAVHAAYGAPVAATLEAEAEEAEAAAAARRAARTRARRVHPRAPNARAARTTRR